MKKLFTALVIAFLLLILAACSLFPRHEYRDPTLGGGEDPYIPVETFTHPLTGIQLEDDAILANRPAAIMVSNIAVARQVQAGMPYADVTFETVVEGGITRYLAVFQDIENMSNVGSIRSARHIHFNLAAGLDAIFVHHGSDRVNTLPAMQAANADNQNIGVNQGAFRHANGLSSEHTLYTSGELLHSYLAGRNVRLTRENPRNLFNFAEDVITLEDSHGPEVLVRFSGASTSRFVFNETTHRYTRHSGNTADTDFFTQSAVEVTNIFILFDDIAPFPNGVHMRANLQGGRGYYITNGGFVPIRWQKGAANDPLRLFDDEGNDLLVNPGRSWISLIPTSTANPVNFNQPAEPV